MSGSARLPRRVWERHKARAFPPGAITFHLAAFGRRRLTEEGSAEAAALRARFGLDELLVLHGSALAGSGGATLVTGPPGIGKSTALRETAAAGLGRVVEDGVLLVGLRAQEALLVTTGTVGVMDRASRIAGRLRRLMEAHGGARRPGDAERPGQRALREAALARVPAVAFTLATGLARGPRAPFAPDLHVVRAAVAVRQPGDPAPPLRLLPDGSLEELSGLELLSRSGVAVLEVLPGDARAGLRSRLAGALREAAAGR